MSSMVSAAVSQAGTSLASASFAASLGGSSLPAGKIAPNNGAANATPGRIPDGLSAADGKKSNQSQAGAATQGPASNNVSGNGQAARPQADAAQAGPATQRPADTGAAPIQAVLPQGSIHEAGSARSHADVTATVQAPHQPVQADAVEGTASSGINTASLIQKMSETEMRVGMHSAEFGDISIRTSVSQQLMTAQISVDHGDLGKAISAHIPAMEAKLGGELGLRALVEVNPGGMQFSGERGSSSPRDQKTVAPALQMGHPAASPETDHVALRHSATAVDEYRLDIRA